VQKGSWRGNLQHKKALQLLYVECTLPKLPQIHTYETENTTKVQRGEKGGWNTCTFSLVRSKVFFKLELDFRGHLEFNNFDVAKLEWVFSKMSP